MCHWLGGNYPRLSCFTLFHSILACAHLLTWHCTVKPTAVLRGPHSTQRCWVGHSGLGPAPTQSQQDVVTSTTLDSISHHGHLQDSLHQEHPIFHKVLNWFLCLIRFESTIPKGFFILLLSAEAPGGGSVLQCCHLYQSRTSGNKETSTWKWMFWNFEGRT